MSVKLIKLPLPDQETLIKYASCNALVQIVMKLAICAATFTEAKLSAFKVCFETFTASFTSGLTCTPNKLPACS